MRLPAARLRDAVLSRGPREVEQNTKANGGSPEWSTGESGSRMAAAVFCSASGGDGPQ